VLWFCIKKETNMPKDTTEAISLPEWIDIAGKAEVKHNGPVFAYVPDASETPSLLPEEQNKVTR
jgi:hypothetical protein